MLSVKLLYLAEPTINRIYVNDINIHFAVGFHCDEFIINDIAWQYLNMLQILNSQKTPHTLPYQWEIWQCYNRIIESVRFLSFL